MSFAKSIVLQIHAYIAVNGFPPRFMYLGKNQFKELEREYESTIKDPKEDKSYFLGAEIVRVKKGDHFNLSSPNDWRAL